MTKSKNSLNKIKSNQISLVRAREFSEYHPNFAKFANRKKLKPSEKGQITKLWKELLNVAYEEGGMGFLTPAPTKVVKKLKQTGHDDLLIGKFNILKLNQYNNGKELDVNSFGDLVQKRKYEKAGRDDLTKGRNFTFVFVDCNFDFSTGKYQKQIDSEEIYDVVKSKILKRYWTSYNKRKAKMPKECEFYLWGKQGVLYKRAASSFALLMVWLEDWVEMYLDRIIEADDALSNELRGWCFHSNIRIKSQAKKVRKNGKKKNSRR